VKISNEFKIGLMAIIVIALSVWGYKFLRGRNLLKPTNNFYVRYQNIDGLAATSPVLIRGMNVGTVSKVELAEDLQTIIATLDIKRGIRIHKDAEAVIISTGLMGGKAIDLQVKGPCSGDDCAESGTFLKGRVQGFLDSFLDTSEGGTLDQIKDNLGDMLNTIGDSLTSPTSTNEIAKTYTQLSHLIKNLASITNTLDNSMGTYDKHLKGTLANVEKLTGTFAKNEQQIGDAIKHLESITRQFDEAKIGTNAGAFLADAQVTMKNLNTSLTEANKSFADLANVMNGLEQGNGSLGKLIKDDALYTNLTNTSKNLNLLLQDFRLNPKRYVNVSVFGKKQKEYEVPEDDPANQ
jgi:phospholipid/cholesterol/gamma-HCH transport system substrate-binding protein